MLIAMHRRTYIGLASLALTSACGFHIPGGSGTSDDAMGSGSDGSNPDSVAAACPWPYVPEYVMPCPATDGPAIDVSSGKAVLDTDAGTLTSVGTTIPIESEVTADVRVVWTRGLHIAAGAQIRVIGSFPLSIIATGAITIDGRLDGGGHANSPLVGDGPPGANPAACNVAGAGVGQPCADQGASGGGGGSFAEMGGQGGGGGDTRNCGVFSGPVPGGSGGAVVNARPSNLRGGCPGAIGGLSTLAGSVAGRAGSGGGAIALVARESLTISGTVNVGGAGGGGCTKRGAGGGGGSGGMIVLEGSTVTVTSGGRVAANGGGGGGGCDMNPSMDGTDGTDSGTGASGGANEGTGTDGGDGGARGDVAQTADVSSRGGGGGGGGVGFVRIHSAIGPGVAEPSSISPPPSP